MTRSTRSLLGFPFAQPKLFCYRRRPPDQILALVAHCFTKLAAALIRWSSCHTTIREMVDSK